MFSDILQFVSHFVLVTINYFGSFGVFLLMTLESANIPIPSEVVMPFSGFLAATGTFSFWFIVLVGATGELTGSLISYSIASRLDGKLMEKMEFKKAERWFEKFGIWSVLIGRFVPIVRTFISFPAGMFKVNVWKFASLTFMGSFIWCFVLTRIGYTLGEKWNVIEPYFRKFDFAIAGALLAGIVWWIWYHFKKK